MDATLLNGDCGIWDGDKKTRTERKLIRPGKTVIPGNSRYLKNKWKRGQQYCGLILKLQQTTHQPMFNYSCIFQMLFPNKQDKSEKYQEYFALYRCYNMKQLF